MALRSEHQDFRMYVSSATAARGSIVDPCGANGVSSGRQLPTLTGSSVIRRGRASCMQPWPSRSVRGSFRNVHSKPFTDKDTLDFSKSSMTFHRMPNKLCWRRVYRKSWTSCHQTPRRKVTLLYFPAIQELIVPIVYTAALQAQTKYENIPTLDIRVKERQVGDLLDQLHKESKMYGFTDQTHREEIMSEVVHSLTRWLNDVWSTYYERHDQYRHAHRCLIYVARSLLELEGVPNPSGCVASLSQRGFSNFV